MNSAPLPPLTAKPSGEKKCLCIKWHRPVPNILHSHHVWPLGEGGPNTSANLLWLCPTTHNNVHELWRIYKRMGKTPPPTMLRPYSRYVRAVVARGWSEKVAASAAHA